MTALTGQLSFGLLLVVAALTSILSLFFDVAYRSFLPSLVMRDNVLEGNSKLATTDALAEVGGPALAGALIQLFGAPLAIFFDAVSFLFSSVSFALIRAPEPPPVDRSAYQSLWRDIVDGLRVMRETPALRTLALAMGLRNFFGSFFGTLYALYAVRDLGLSPAILGFLVAGGGIGALFGALLAERLPRRFGLGRALTGALLVSGTMNLLIPLAGGVSPLLAAQIIGDAAMMVYGVNEMSLRQMLAPERVLGRVNASFGFLAEGVAPLGALVAGALATLVGSRGTLWAAALGILLVALWVFTSPVRALRIFKS